MTTAIATDRAIRHAVSSLLSDQHPAVEIVAVEDRFEPRLNPRRRGRCGATAHESERANREKNFNQD